MPMQDMKSRSDSRASMASGVPWSLDGAAWRSGIAPTGDACGPGPRTPRRGDARTWRDSRWRHAGARGRIEPWALARKSSGRRQADVEVVDAGGRIVMPGFVDAHTHPVFAGTRADEFEERDARRQRMRRSPRAAAASAPPCGRHARGHAKRNCWRRRAATATGFCAAAPPRWRRNRATDFRSKRKCKMLRVVARLNGERKRPLRAHISGRARSSRRISRANGDLYGAVSRRDDSA